MTNLSENPLLKPFSNRDGAVPFDLIKVEHYLPAAEEAIRTAKANIERVKNDPSPATFDNTVVALDAATELVDRITGIYSNLEVANADEALQAVAKDLYPMLSAFSSDVTLDPKLFGRYKELHDRRASLNLTGEQTRLLEKNYLAFVRNGALLDEKSKERIRAIDQEFSVLGTKFSENVLKATNAFELWVTDAKELDGLPEGAIEAAAMAAEAKGKKGQWFFNLQIPSYLPVLTYAKNRAMREKLWRAYAARSYKGDFDNAANIRRIVTLRAERAKLLGYDTHADYVLAERMAKDPKTVDAFLSRLLSSSKDAAQRDLDEVKAFAKEDGLADFQPWDFAFYSEKLKEKKYAFNEEDLRPYFQLEKVIEGVFEHARRLYGLAFKEVKDVPVYHPEVRVFEVTDAASGKFISLFYTDFFPRETKKGGAWMTNFREQGTWGGKLMRPHVSIVCNFTKPTPTKPSLLTHDEVSTLFHEFGHALHGMLSECTYRSLSGTNVYWDFVELPSQIMENWVKEKEGLDLFARHYQTNEPIPDELVQKLKRAQKFQSGWMSLRQLGLGLLDMAWHTADPSVLNDIDQFETSATSVTRLLPKVEGTNTSSSFSHIFAGGYSAGYYSYKWAEVLDADAFEYFKEKGLFDPEVSRLFKDYVLSRGGTEHPMELYKKFRGREPDPNALLRRDGLI